MSHNIDLTITRARSLVSSTRDTPKPARTQSVGTLAAMLTDPETTSCKRTILGSTRLKINKTIGQLCQTKKSNFEQTEIRDEKE